MEVTTRLLRFRTTVDSARAVRASSAHASAHPAYQRGTTPAPIAQTACARRVALSSFEAYDSMLRREATVCRGADASRLLCSRQRFVGESRGRHHRQSASEPLAIVRLAVVKPERLLVNVRAEVERLDRHVSAVQRSREQRPEVLDAVSVDVAAHVLDLMIDEVVRKAGFAHPLSGVAFVRHDARSGFDVLVQEVEARPEVERFQDLRADFSVSLKNGLHDRFSRGTIGLAPSLDALTFGCMHVLHQTADVTFIGLDDARHFPIEGLRFDCGTDAMQHEPRGFLRHVNGPVKLVARHAILAVHRHPDRHEPLGKADRRVFEDRSDANRKLFLAGFALPYLARGDERVFGSVTERAKHTIRPAEHHGEVERVVFVGKKDDGFLKRTRSGLPFRIFFLSWHTNNLSPGGGCVKYINARTLDLIVAGSIVTKAPRSSWRERVLSADKTLGADARGGRILRSHLDDTRTARVRRSQDVAEIEIVRENDEAVFARKIHDVRIAGCGVSEIDPMLRLNAVLSKERRPLRAEIHVDQKSHFAIGTSNSSERHAAYANASKRSASSMYG